MSGRWVDVKEPSRARRPAWLSPGLIVGATFAVLILIVIVGVLISRGGSGEELQTDLTIAQLRADPEGYNGVQVELVGTISNRYTIPLLDQYGLYEIDDGTGSMFVLSDKGAPPDDGAPVRLTATFNGAVELDDQIRQLVEDQFGAAAGFVADQILPGLPLNVLYLTHQRYEPIESDATPEEVRVPGFVVTTM